ncbi:hypothetical protein HID58_035234 [Brassica napus]|uniref:RING-type domain-containing protein n=1 Tax=Brassica napus TaxID=3708 RepID=A0ABQ8C4P0_BRANA|nr:hypothetical protein HID58_035234 [Brassica napus]
MWEAFRMEEFGAKKNENQALETDFAERPMAGSGNIPKRFGLDMSKDFIPMSVFSESSSQGKMSVEGKIKNKFHMSPRTENMESYGKLCRERATKSMCKNKQIQVIDNATGMYMWPTPGTVAPTGTFEKKKVTTKTTEMKRTRRDRREMEEVMFNLFERQSHWTLRNLIQDTDQPEQFLKDLLRDLCIYNNKGSNQGTYELKPEDQCELRGMVHHLSATFCLKNQCGDVRSHDDDDEGYNLTSVMFGDKEKKEEEEICCSICLMDYEDEDAVTQLPRCNHLFHVHCIEPWLLRGSLTCPLCRSFVFSQTTTPTHNNVINVHSSSTFHLSLVSFFFLLFLHHLIEYLLYSLNVQQGAGDPLYVAEGQPKCFDPDIVDATPTEDGCSWEPWISSIHLHAYQVVELPSLLNTRKVLKAVAPLPPILQKKVRAKTISSCKFSWISLPPDNITCDSLKVILLGKHT